jgi:hypothetical protein
MILIGTLVGLGALVESGVRLEVDDEETGKRQSLKCSRGHYSRGELEAYRNQRVEIELEIGDMGKWKLVRISFPSPTIRP